MSKHDIRISGMGGQGVILSGIIIGKAAAIFEDRQATLIQSFGPEARGSAVSAQLMISDDPIAYPYIKRSDILMVYSRAGFDKFVPELKEDGILIYENELVVPNETTCPNAKKFGIPAINLAEQHMGKAMALNMIMCGFFTAVTKIITPEAMRKAIADTTPSETISFNTKAFDLGLAEGLKREITATD